MSSDDSDAPARFDPRFAPSFQRGSHPGAGAAPERAVVRSSSGAPRSFQDHDRAGTDALEAAFAGEVPQTRDAMRIGAATAEVADQGPLDESDALTFVRRCGLGCLGLVAALLAVAVVWQAIAPTGMGRQWVYFFSQFVFIAAPGLFVFGIVALVFVGYRRRLTRPEARDSTEGTPLP
ncbi:MAG: hypothetical protein ABWZ77_03455 [Naasia sp.]